MRKYKHINLPERIRISELKEQGYSINKISKSLKRSASTISRELKRNQWEHQYWPDSANRMNRSRRLKGNIIDKDDPLRVFIIRKLTRNRWTPEQIAGFLKHRQKDLRKVSHETIYKWMYGMNQIANKYWKFLARHKRKRGLRKSNNTPVKGIPNRISIHDRPKNILLKTEFGHWEGDLISFQNNSQHALVIHERKTRYIQSSVLSNKQATTTSTALKNKMEKLPDFARQSITLDNGGEFYNHMDWQAIGLNSYFCDPYSSWQKGGVENSNGRLRRVLPRSTDIFSIPEDEYDRLIDNHNSTPRKCLNWKSPKELFIENLTGVALQT